MAARVDHEAVARSQKQIKAYDALKDALRKNILFDFDGDYGSVLDHLQEMENTMTEQQQELIKYRRFFSELNDLLPKRPTKFG